MRHIILISGKDSLATAIVQIEREPSLPYELVNNETGWDLPETLDWISRVGEFLARPIIRCGDDLTDICYEQNCLPLAGIRRFCTKYAKIKPLNDFLGKSEATIYFGLRNDEPDRVGYDAPKHQTPRYPLREAGFGISDVWRKCAEVDLLPPAFHWPWMESRVRFLLGQDQWLLDNLPPWERRQLLAWRTRSNCDRCPFMRQYERIGLYEFHPDRFEDSCRLEEDLCHRDEFTWVRGYRQRELIARSDEIKERRAVSIVKYLREKQVRYLWQDDEFVDELAVTSCGLLCGK
jgi:hypothetical protein